MDSLIDELKAQLRSDVSLEAQRLDERRALELDNAQLKVLNGGLTCATAK